MRKLRLVGGHGSRLLSHNGHLINFRPARKIAEGGNYPSGLLGLLRLHHICRGRVNHAAKPRGAAQGAA